MTQLPCFIPVTFPDLSTVATFLSDEVHVTSPTNLPLSANLTVIFILFPASKLSSP